MFDVYGDSGINISSCSVNKFIQGSIIVDYVLGFASDAPNVTSLNEVLTNYTKECKQNCFGMNSSASFSDYKGMINKKVLLKSLFDEISIMSMKKNR